MGVTTATTMAGRAGRRTQEERRADTRRRLLAATVAALAELGWSGTSTTEVARRAGVSRGAQQHHFPTKLDLIAAAVDYTLAEQQREFERAFHELPANRRTVDGAVDLLWEDVFRSATFIALVELAMAARTDAELRALCRDIPDRVHTVVSDTVRRLFPRLAEHESLPVLLRSIMALFTGLALERGVGAHTDIEVIALVKRFAREL